MDTENPLDAVIAEYLQAVERGEVPHRQELLDRYPALAEDLRTFFAQLDHVDQLAAPLRLDPTTDGTPCPAPPDRIRYFGDYELLEEIARGGMGIVYKARQTSLNRIVALKMILKGTFATPRDVARFRAEAESAANLDHPNIVPIHEVGEHDGHQYYTMRFIEGRPLNQTPRADARSETQCLITIARAVHYAHQRGILHRDLKPSNILLQNDERGTMNDEKRLRGSSFIVHRSSFVPSITDFGLAKRLDAERSLTESGQVIGTPKYMAPEQAASRKDLTIAADVYSLGVILYERLTGRTPFTGDDPLTILRQVRETEPPRPSTITAGIDRDLETVVLKCLEKEPAKRYASAAELGDDLERWFRGEPILARPPTIWNRANKWVKRRPTAAALIGVSCLGVSSLVTMGILYGTDLRRANTELQNALQDTSLAKEDADRERRFAEAQELESRQHLYVADMNLAQRAWDEGHTEQVLDLLRRHQHQAGNDLRSFPWYHFWRLCHRDRLTSSGHNQLVAFSPDGSCVAFRGSGYAIRVCDMATGVERFVLRRHNSPVLCAAFSPDGKLLGTGSEDGTFILCDAHSGVERADIAVSVLPRSGLHARGPITELAISCTVNVIAAKVGPVEPGAVRARTMLLFDPFSRALKGDNTNAILPGLGMQGNDLLIRHTDGTFGLIDLTRPSEQRRFPKPKSGGVITCDAFSPDGRRIATGSTDVSMIGMGGIFTQVIASAPKMGLVLSNVTGEVNIWDRESRTVEHRLLGHAGLITCVRFNAIGDRLASGSIGGRTVSLLGQHVNVPGQLKLWDTLTGREVVSTDQPDGVWCVTFSPDGRRGAFGTGAEGAVKIFDAATGRVIATYRGHTATVFGLAFSNDGNTLVSASEDGTIKYWDTNLAPEPLQFQGLPTAKSLSFSPDGGTLAFQDNTARLINLATGESQSLGTATEGVVFTPDGKSLILAGYGWVPGTVAVWDIATKKVRSQMKPGGWLAPRLNVAVSSDSRTVATTVVNSSEIKQWDVASGSEKLAFKLQGDVENLPSIAFSPDSLLLAVGRHDGSVELFDATTGVVRKKFGVREAVDDVMRLIALGVSGIAFSPDGRTLATGHAIQLDYISSSMPTEIRLWNVETGKLRRILKGHLAGVKSVAFSSDGRILASAGDDRTIRLWDVASGQHLITFRGDKHGFRAVAISPDNNRLAALDENGTVRVWHAATRREVAQRLDAASAK